MSALITINRLTAEAGWWRSKAAIDAARAIKYGEQGDKELKALSEAAAKVAKALAVAIENEILVFTDEAQAQANIKSSMAIDIIDAVLVPLLGALWAKETATHIFMALNRAGWLKESNGE